MSPATAAKKAPATKPGGPRAGGARLADAFEAITRLPALCEARHRLMNLTDAEAQSAGDVAEAVESDAALAIAVMRAANNGAGPPARVGGVREAVDALTPGGVRVIASSLETYDPFEGEGSMPARLRAVPPARRCHPVRRRPRRRGGAHRPARRARHRGPAPRCRKARARPTLRRRLRSRPGRPRHPRPASGASVASWGSTTRWSAPSWSAAGA